MLKVFYPELFAGTKYEAMARELAPKCYEFSAFLVNKLGVTDLGARFPHKVTFHDGCHGLRELNNKRPPRELLAKVRGLELVEMARGGDLLRFRRHVLGQVPHDLHRHGRGQMRQRAGHRRRVYRLVRFELPDAAPGLD